MLVICREFHWSIEEFKQTDSLYIDMIWQMLGIQADEMEQERKRLESKLKRK